MKAGMRVGEDEEKGVGRQRVLPQYVGFDGVERSTPPRKCGNSKYHKIQRQGACDVLGPGTRCVLCVV